MSDLGVEFGPGDACAVVSCGDVFQFRSWCVLREFTPVVLIILVFNFCWAFIAMDWSNTWRGKAVVDCVVATVHPTIRRENMSATKAL